MATTDGLTMATTSAIEGNIGACPSVDGGVQSGSMGLTIESAGGLVGGGASSGGSRQPLPTKRNITMTRQASRYFRFVLFMASFIVAWGVEFEQRAFGAISLLCKAGKICYTTG